MRCLEVSLEIQETFLEWPQYHYKDNLAGLVFFNPRVVNNDYPCGDINVLVVLKESPEQDRERYDRVAQILVRNLIADKELLCRIQTVNEIEMLHEIQLPLLNIYLTHTCITNDPHCLLEAAKAVVHKKVTT